MIATSRYFDSAWYLQANDDVRRTGVDPLVHFLLHGEEEGRDPGPDFDTAAYVLLNPDAQGAALTHFHRIVAAADSPAPDITVHTIVARDLRAIKTQWFDESWYRATHDTSATFACVHPLVHYYRIGLDPSPVFDNIDYQSQLSEAGINANPLDHWLDVVPEHDPPIRPRVVSHAPSDHPLDRPLIQHRVRARSEFAEAKVAAMIHAFYLDLLPSVLERIALLPANPMLLISVATTSDASDGHRMIDEILGTDQPRIIKVVPNRGRNFAPLLCSFAEEVADHDYVLHLHTKKSLYSGSEKSSWRDHLLTSLLPSAPAVDAILSLLADDPTVGVVQAPVWEGVPTWGNHWLGNGPVGADLYERLGVEDRSAHGYLMYPVGGMFWAKVDALQPLLDLRLTVGDFDREHGQTDRTLAHAIERTIPAAAATRGFDTVEFDYTAAQWRRNWSEALLFQDESTDIAGLRAALQSADLVSVDLFDTLVLRPTLDPASLFEVLSLQFDAEVKTPEDRARTSSAQLACGHDLVRFRRESEDQLRRSGEIAGDVTLDEIYTNARSQHAAVANQLDRLKQLELDLERRVAIPRTWLIEELLNDRIRSRQRNGPPRRYILMTDTTQPLNAIEDLLHQIGAGELFDDLYVSNACRARKDSGSMWELVRTLETPEAARWLHLGDNEFSDIQQAADRGLAWFHIPAPGSAAQVKGVDTSLLAPGVRIGTELVGGHGLAALASSAHRFKADEDFAQTAMEDFGYGVLGPLTLSFINWLTHAARAREVDRLLFSARDGHLAFEILRRVRTFLPADIPQLDYFLMSRRVALAISQHSGEHFDRVVAADYTSGSVADLLDVRLGLRLPGERGAQLGAARITLPRDSAWLIEQLEEFREAIAAHGREELRGFRAYLDFLEISPDEHLGFVDLGYSGTTQRAITTVIDQHVTGFYYVTTSAADQLGTDSASCFGRDVVVGNSNLIYGHAMLFELLCSAEHPQVSRFIADPRGLRVEFDARSAAPPALRQHIETAQAAAIRFVHDHVERFGPEALDERVDPLIVMSSLKRSAEMILPNVEAIFEGFEHADPFSGRSNSKLT
ncbi:rhamnan synthesis F family protein [Ilumatobacter sp.]|uniref:rhamnan synthesis F family protein n=1 Tax=Ilumatobacter sp. TaxID=1967498 RepID=UPI002A27DAEB|nr:rhamnan synthesis F family protein [Ilumatobacter sp.]